MMDLRGVRTADVYKAGVRAGTLTRRDSGTVEFSYVPGYTGQPVAFTLPIDSAPAHAPGGGLPPFFTGLLPEGHRLTVLTRATKTSMDDELTLLLAIGSDLPGDVQVVPAGTLPTAPEPLVSGSLAEADFAVLTDSVDGVGIAGVQSKASASMVNTPVMVGSQHGILKIDPPEHPGLVRNEALHLRHASRLGIPVAQWSLVHDVHGRDGLLVTRFDRPVSTEAVSPTQTERYAMEDAAQLLGIVPAVKYAVDSEELVRAVCDAVRARPVALRNLFIQFFFAWLTGNGDLHAKNISVLQNASGTWAVAPVYDIPCTALYRDYSMALPIAGRRTNIRARHWREFIHGIGLPRRAALSAARTCLDVARGIDLAELGLEGSPLYGAQRELRHRRAEAETLLEELAG